MVFYGRTGGLVGLLSRGFGGRTGFTKPGKRRGSFKKTFRRKFRKMRYRKKRYNKKSIGEIKYSPCHNGLALTPGQIASTDHGPATLLQDCWPTAGTGVQNVIGRQLYIRKLIITLTVANTKTNNQQSPMRFLLLKSKKFLGGIKNNAAFTHSSTDPAVFPNLFTSTLAYSAIPIAQGLGKTIFDKKLTPPAAFTTQDDWVDQANYVRSWKKTIRINKVYEKDINYGSNDLFNHAGYYLYSLLPTSGQFAGTGAVMNLNYYFTYTDV
ncbi:coat protein [Lake Sarah-associated circular virus-33]|uniref:coat protein n=1 Tax=Lake Sarah-associated circular virus-33 TaxID=1685761 RepID=UPI000777208B|nr:coat protein [Lake Sarah-associated circular virus-33]ALE29732.1 coat protein [Lake Sarah-associated circular virus-33]